MVIMGGTERNSRNYERWQLSFANGTVLDYQTVRIFIRFIYVGELITT